MSEELKTSSSGVAFNEIGNTGLKNSGGMIYEEFLPKLQWPRAGAVYHERPASQQSKGQSGSFRVLRSGPARIPTVTG